MTTFQILQRKIDMILKVIASGSKGNSYALIGENEILLIEAGVPLMEVKKAIDFQVSKVVGCLVSHEHLDHSKHVKDYEKIGFPIFKPYESVECRIWVCGAFLVKCFELEHDVPCFGYLITHPEMGTLLFATDTQYIKYRFKHLSHIMVEANYSLDLTSKEDFKRSHVLCDHMEIDTTCEFLRVNDNPNLRNVILLHLSEGSSDEAMFKRMAEKMVDCPVYVADKGMKIELLKDAF